MLRGLLIAVVLIGAAAGGYYLFVSGNLQQAAEQARETAETVNETTGAAAESAVETMETAQDTAEETITQGAETAGQAMEQAADTAENALQDGMAAAEDAASELAEAARQNGQDAMENAANAVEESLAALAGDSATEPAAEPAAPVVQSESDDSLLQYLTVENYDFDRVSEMIDGSELADMQKTGLKVALQQAESNEETLQAILDRVGELLGLQAE
ncbi:hypothetical protein [Pseudaestuariivita rosea]|uniref:hypothetical protein n=1 Tax=Pseudaestuariivita rosea TaxID=2763263 RepID=UPI001ABA3D40|nr:hypothetical protein [Pseudaestuariivita rosea]